MDSLDLVSPYLFRYKKRNFLVKGKLQPKDLDDLQHFEIHPTDIFLITYPKSGNNVQFWSFGELLTHSDLQSFWEDVVCGAVALNCQEFPIYINELSNRNRLSGTTWMQQVLVKIMEAADPDWVEDASNRVRVSWLEERTADDPGRDRPAPRIFGSHLPPDMLPHGVKDKQIKIVYVWRNPKDVLVSFYHFAHSWVLLETPQSFEDFFQQFLDGDVYMGSWFDHVREYCAAREQLNIHFVQYENMLKDLRGEVVKLCAFLEKDLTDKAIDHVVEASTFKSMKTNPKANYKDLIEVNQYKTETMRKGEAGDWKNFFTVTQNEHFDKVFKEKISSCPLTCTWEVKQ